MRKFLKHFPFNKVFTALFVLFYTFLPSAQAIGIVMEESSVDDSTKVDISEDILEDGISDPKEIANPEVVEEEIPESTFKDGVYTVNSVGLKEYVYPDNEDVRVKFTNITEEGNLVISKVELTEEEKEELNTYDNYGWDITSTMSNGSFTYDLTLPNTSGNDDVEVKYTEDGEIYTSIEEVVVNEDVIYIEGLEHFTVFVVVVDDGDTDFSAPGWSSHDSGYKGDHRYVSPSFTGEAATWKYTGTDISNGAVFLSWTIWDDHATNATYTSSIDGFGSQVVNQKEFADQNNTGTNRTWSGWYRVLGNFDIPTGSTVTLSPISGTDGNLSADAIAFVDLNEVPNEVWVDDNYSFNNTGYHFWGYDAFNTIRDGVNAVASGGTVHVAEGMYYENINIGKRLILTGAGSGEDSSTSTIIKPSNTNNPVLTINASGTSDSERLVLSNIRVDGTNSNLDGIYIQGSGNYTTFSNVASVNNGRHGVHLPGSSNNVGYEFIITDCVFSNNGGVGFRTGSAAKISGLTITNTQADHNYSAGLYFTGPLTGLNISGGSFDDNYGDSNNSNGVGIYTDYSGGGGINRGFGPSGYKTNSIKNTSVSGNSRGIILNILGGSSYLFEDITASNNNALSTDSGQGITIGSRDNITQEIKFSKITAENNSKSNLWFITYDSSSVSNLSIQNSTLTGSTLSTAGYGLYLYAIGGSVLSNVSVTGSTITGNNTGIYLRAGSPTATLSNMSIEENSIGNNGTGILISNNISSGNSAHKNNIVGNTATGVQNNDSDTDFDATLNWWGHITGPSTVGNGLGDKVSTNVTYQEWLCAPYQENATSVQSVSGVCTLTAPIQTGYNVKNSPTDPENTPRPINEIACTGGYTNINSVSVHWTDVSGEDPNVKYERQYRVNNGNWGGNEIYTNPYTGYRSFGGGTGNDGLYGSRVREFYDTNRNGQYNEGEPVSEWSDECSITYDKTVPTVFNVNVDKTFVKAGDTITITADVTDNNGVLAVSADFSYNENYTSRPTPTSVTMTKTSENTYQVQYIVPSSWTDGTMYVKVAARDLTGGNWVRSTDFDTVTVDNTPPDKPILIQPLNNSVVKGAVLTSSWSSIPDADHYIYESYHDAEATKVRYHMEYPTTSKTAYNVSDATFWWRVKAVDAAGNESQWSNLWKVTIDNTAPIVEITSPNDGGIYNTDVTLSGTVTDANPHHYWLKIIKDGTNLNIPSVTGTHSATEFETTLTEGGKYHVTFAARDAVGGTSDSGNRSGDVNISFTIDKTPPATPTATFLANGLSVLTNGYTNSETFTFNLSSSEDTTRYQLKYWNDILGSTYKEISPWNPTDLSGYSSALGVYNDQFTHGEGKHYFSFSACDIADNCSNYSTPFVVYYDKTTPTTTITSPTSGYITNTTPEITGYTKDTYSVDKVVLSYTDYNTETSQCGDTWTELTTINNSNKETVPFNWSYTEWNLEDGAYCIKAQATDLANNEEHTAIVENVIYDTTPPQITLLDLVLGVLRNVDANDSLSGIDKIEVSKDNIKWEDYTLDMDLNDLVGNQPGTYTIYIRVTDKAGNPTKDSVTFTIPSPTPTTTQTAGEILGVKSPLNPTPVQALGIGGYLYTQATNGEQDTEEEETTKEEIVTQEEEAEVKGEEDNGEQNSEEETTEEEGTKWWVYPLVILPVLAIFLILWKRRKEEDEPQF